MKVLEELLHGLVDSRLWVVRAKYVSVTGAMHEADRIPNQDKAFTMLRPDINAYKHHEKRHRPKRRRAPGLFAVGVFDGHGPQGDAASSLAAERMEHALSRLLHSDKPNSLIDIVRDAFEEVAMALNSSACSTDSGSTGSLVLVKDDDVVIANVGDSSVLFVSRTNWREKIRFKTRKHRPTDEDEANRILAFGGYIQEGYVVDEGAKNGIAVSRTLGDRDMQQYGCISKPDVRHFKIRKEDSALLLASDGLWDVPGLDFQKVVKTVAKKKGRNPQGVCETLLGLASTNGGPTDDCTIACLTLD